MLKHLVHVDFILFYKKNKRTAKIVVIMDSILLPWLSYDFGLRFLSGSEFDPKSEVGSGPGAGPGP